MTKLPVNELFETIQGEAAFTGTPSTFVRLQGCDVGCPWCDTKHTWEIDQTQEIEPVAMLAKADGGRGFAWLSVDELVSAVDNRKSRHVVITGGEPATHDLAELTRRLIESGRTVQIETSGTRPILVEEGVWVTLSPKLAMPGGRQMEPTAWGRADEVKMPVGKPVDVHALKALIARLGAPALVWLQPLSMSQKATALCIEAAREHGWRISVQTHKAIGVR